MAKTISTLAFLIFLTSSPVLAVGQNASRPCTDDLPATATNNSSHREDDHSEGRQTKSTDSKRKDKKTKHAAKPAPSNQEQDNERALWGIFG